MNLLRVIGAIVMLVVLVVGTAITIGFVHWAFWYGTWLPLAALDSVSLWTYLGLAVVVLLPLSWQGLARVYLAGLLSIVLVALLRLVYIG